MKKFNLFAMGLLAAAAVSFTACSSNDDLSSNASQQQSVDGFYPKIPLSNHTDCQQAESWVTTS